MTFFVIKKSPLFIFKLNTREPFGIHNRRLLIIKDFLSDFLEVLSSASSVITKNVLLWLVDTFFGRQGNSDKH